MFSQIRSSHTLPNGDDFESISSTNLTIKTTLSSLNSNNQSAQKSISKTTKTISPSPTKQQLNKPHSKAGKEQERIERPNSSSSSRRHERGSTQPSKQPAVDNSRSSDKNELKHVFAKLQHKSVAQKLRQHLGEEEAEGAKPAKEDREENVEGSTANLKSKLIYKYILCAQYWQTVPLIDYFIMTITSGLFNNNSIEGMIIPPLLSLAKEHTLFIEMIMLLM